MSWRGVTILVLETEDARNDLRGIIPFGVSIYFDLIIRDMVDGWTPSSSDISLLVSGETLSGLFPKKSICLLQIISPTFNTVSFLLLIDDINHFASSIFFERPSLGSFLRAL